MGEADGVTVDLRYAALDALTGRAIHSHPVAMLEPRPAALLAVAVRRVAVLGLRFRVYDASRSIEAQWALWHALQDARFVADPRPGDAFARSGGGPDAVGRGGVLPMGAGFDAMEPAATHGASGLAAEVVRNRALLLGLMVASGWEAYMPEWWHCRVPGCGDWPVLSAADVPDGPMRG